MDLEKLLASLDTIGESVKKGHEELKGEYIALKKEISDSLESKATAEQVDAKIEAKFAEITEKHEGAVKEIEWLKEQYEKGLSADPTNLSGYDQKEAENFSILKMSRAMITGDWEKEAPYEKAVIEEIRKAQTTSDNSQGGFVIPRQVANEVIELLRAKTVVLGMGARTLTGLVGSPYEQPKIKNGGVAYWVGEGDAITESEIGFGMVTMTPKQLSALVGMTNRWFRMATPDGEGMIRNDLATVLGLKLDEALLLGTGGSNQPLGISGQSGVLTHTGSVAPTYDLFTDLVGLLEDANSLQGAVGFVAHPKVRRVLKKQKIAQYSGDTAGDPIFSPILSDAGIDNAIGYPFRTTTQLNVDAGGTDLAEVFGGNWNELIVGIWSNLEFAVATEATVGSKSAFANNMRFIRVITELDSMVRHGASFLYKTNCDVS